MNGHVLVSGAQLVLGGARSGKSIFAERLAQSAEGKLHYVATAQPFDGDMRSRIATHRERRGERWVTHEEPLELLSTLDRIDARDGAILVDCLTLWLSNLLHAERDVAHECDRLANWASGCSQAVIFVSNEVGLGIVPENALARRFRDEAGRLHQAIASVSQAVYFVAAGLPLKMK